MNTDESTHMLDLINADATNGKSVLEIFKKLLDTNWNSYIKSLCVEKYINKVRNYIKEFTSPNDVNKNSDNIINVDVITNNILHYGPFSTMKKIINTSFTKINEINIIINNIETDNNAIKDKTGTAVNRVKENLKCNSCPITFALLKDCAAIYILSCCSLIISDEAVSFLTIQDNKVFSCPNCRTEITTHQCICIDKTVDLDDIIEGRMNVKKTQNETQQKNEIQDEELNTISKSTKYTVKQKCLAKILNNESQDYEEIELYVHGILYGFIPQGFADYTKILVFSMYENSFESLIKIIIDSNIKFAKVHGTSVQIAEIVRKYKLPYDDPDAYNLLLINGTHYCAGLNLQNTTDIIFTHMVTNTAQRSQIIGRCARIGRIHDLRVHHILYENEYINNFT